MPQPRTSTSSTRTRGAAVRLARVAERQWGVVSRAQLHDAGLTEASIARWVRDGQLHRLHLGVYALGHRALAVEGRVLAAALWAGPGALVSHTTAAWWWRLLDTEPRVVHLSVPGRTESAPGVRVHRPRELDGTTHSGLPVTSVARTLVDLSSMLQFAQLRRALAEAEYKRLVDAEALRSLLRRGRPGSAKLRAALDRHQPRLAHTLSVLEERFLALCEDGDIPLPEVNVRVAGLLVDAFWPEQRLVVELDGHAAHGTPAAAERDRARELRLRAAGCRVLRYTWRQINEQPELVESDLAVALT